MDCSEHLKQRNGGNQTRVDNFDFGDVKRGSLFDIDPQFILVR